MTDSDTAENAVWIDVVAAASLLFVSRSHAEKLAADGHLGNVRRTKDGRMLVLDSAVASYRAQMKLRQKRGLAQMVEASKRAGLYAREDAELAHLRRTVAPTTVKRKRPKA